MILLIFFVNFKRILFFVNIFLPLNTMNFLPSVRRQRCTIIFLNILISVNFFNFQITNPQNQVKFSDLP